MSAPSRARLERKSQFSLEKARRIARARAFNRQQAKLGCNPATRGEAACLPICRQHAVARPMDRKRIAPERLAALPRETPLRGGMRFAPELLRDLAIGARRTGGNGACDLINAAIKRRDAIHVESDPGKIDRLAVQEGNDCINDF